MRSGVPYPLRYNPAAIRCGFFHAQMRHVRILHVNIFMSGGQGNLRAVGIKSSRDWKQGGLRASELATMGEAFTRPFRKNQKSISDHIACSMAGDGARMRAIRGMDKLSIPF